MPYREPPPPPSYPRAPTKLPRAPIAKAPYWTTYSVVFLFPLVLAGVLAFDGLTTWDGARANWTAAEGALTARDVKLLRILRAFVASQRASADRAEVDRWLAGAKPAVPGHFAYLGAAWPELGAFVERELAA